MACPEYVIPYDCVGKQLGSDSGFDQKKKREKSIVPSKERPEKEENKQTTV